MIRRVFAAVLALAATAGLARAQSVNLLVVESVNPDRKELVAQTTITQFVPITKEIVVEVNGKVEKRTVTEVVAEMRTVQQTVALGSVAAYSGVGAKLDTDTVLKGLKKGSVVVTGPKALADKKYAGVFGPDAVLLLSDVVVPPPGVSPFPPPVPLPVPVPKGF